MSPGFSIRNFPQTGIPAVDEKVGEKEVTKDGKLHALQTQTDRVVELEQDLKREREVLDGYRRELAEVGLLYAGLGEC